MAASMRLVISRTINNNRKSLYFTRVNVPKRCIADLIVNHKVKIDPDVKQGLEDGSIKSPKQHPGLVTVKAVKLPKELLKAMEAMLENYPVKDMRTKSEELYRYLWSRELRQSDQNIQERKKQLQGFYFDKARKKQDIESLSDKKQEELMQKIHAQVTQRLFHETYNWKAIQYDALKSMLYMYSRLHKEYSVLYQVFSEIMKRDGDFKPRTMFDFGSGVGTAIWASNAVWPRSIYEYMGVDVSDDMNTLSRLLLQGGSPDGNSVYKGVYLRQYLPVDNENKHDLVVSAFTFIELGTKAERLQTLLSLWERTEKYLIVVENGTNAGFQLVTEARDFLLQVGADGMAPQLTGHVFSPCPHDSLCPRGLRNDGTPCNFEVVSDRLPKNMQSASRKPFRYSYVVLKKGERDPSDPGWPRIVRATSAPSKMVQCRTCTVGAQLERTCITAAKHGRELFRCARASRWGDLVPMLTEVNSDPGAKKSPDTETESEENSETCTESAEKDNTGGALSPDIQTVNEKVQNNCDLEEDANLVLIDSRESVEMELMSETKPLLVNNNRSESLQKRTSYIQMKQRQFSTCTNNENLCEIESEER